MVLNLFASLFFFAGLVLYTGQIQFDGKIFMPIIIGTLSYTFFSGLFHEPTDGTITKFRTMNKAAEQVLKTKKMRVTPARTEVLGLFIHAPSALSHSDLEKKLGSGFDRVTLYRTLTSFLENGLIHKVPDETGAQRFAYCNHEHHEHEGEH
eukprot:gene12465-15870_t